MSSSCIAVGSNQDPERNIQRALGLLAKAGRIVAVSTFYRTAPIGGSPGGDFLNGMLLLESDFSARALKFEVLRRIEDQLGRIRSADRNAARPIDLDLILHDEEVVHEPGLELPHPDLFERAFVARALGEIRPDLPVPGCSLAAGEIERMAAPVSMVALEDFSRKLREGLLHEFGQGRGTD